MLRPANRFKKDQDFQSVFKYGRSVFGVNLRLKLKPNNLSASRFGLVVGTAISKKATVRNRLRRRLREVLRLKIKAGQIKPGFDVVINVKPEALTMEYQQLDKEINELLTKAGLC